MSEFKKQLGFNKQYFIGINQQNQKITDRYQVIKKLGKGGYGIVYEIQNKDTKAKRACKVLSKSKVNDDFEKEKEIMIKVDHPNIVKLYEIYQDPKFYYLVMEECSGGELFDKIIEKIESKKMYTEKDAANLIQQVIMAIASCHRVGICHRDLKPENLLFSSKSPKACLKVIDFGLAKDFGDDNRMKKKVGTAYYVAPEVLKGDYDQRCDVWSAGVILYILLSGDPPFNGKNDNEIYQKIYEMKYDFPSKKWNKISEEAKDLIKKMLSPQAHRPEAEDVLRHPWFNKINNSENPAVIDLDIETFKGYVNSSKLKKAVLTYVADRLDEGEIEKLKNNFIKLDKDKNGTITLKEFKTGLKGRGLSEIELEKMFSSIDTDNSGTIDYTEFIASSLNVKKDIREVHLHDAFLSFDLDNSGKISKEELMKILRIEDGDEKANSLTDMIEQIDINGDGEIDYNEFLKMMYSA